MNHKPVSNEIHCNSCGYEGRGKSNSTLAFLVLVVIFCTSVVFLPMIIVALAYMVWILSKPVSYACPQCKSKDVAELKPAAVAQPISQKNILEDN